MSDVFKGALHYIELWVLNLNRAWDEWGWLLANLRYETYQNWVSGISWKLGPTYIVVEESPYLSSREHQRTAPGLNHLAFNAGSRESVDALARESGHQGWNSLFVNKYPHSGGPDHYAAYLANSDGFEVELVARP